jgi:hypothetical protein
MDVEIKPFVPDDALEIVKETRRVTKDDIIWAQANGCWGPGFTAFVDGKPVGCFGMRDRGIGEGWAYISESIKEHPVTVLRTAIEEIEKIKQTNMIWRVLADVPQDQKACEFLEFLGFRKMEMYVKGDK